MPANKILHRWLAVGLLLAVISLLLLVIVMPIVTKGLALHEEEQSLLFRLQQYQRIVANKDHVMTSMDTIKQQYSEQNYLNSQETDALASAEIQEVIKKAIVDAGGTLSSTQAMPITNQNDFGRITVSVRMTGNSEALRQVLYQIKTATPFIIIDQIDIRPMRGRHNLKTRQIDPSNVLNINFQAVSFMRGKKE